MTHNTSTYSQWKHPIRTYFIRRHIHTIIQFKDLEPLKIRYYLYILASIIFDILLINCTIVEERLLMLSNFGLQMEYINLYGNKTVKSIPISNIKDLLINEGFVVNEIIFYILIMLNDSEEIILPFKDAIPRLENLKTIYRCFNSLFERPS
ncbi:hypothetical protein BEWA_026150 [Theileria equi strain WA]|uniref:Phosphatidylinositol N-acetylglucosaminyltransferase subunit H conserved domain-containing protein n=1 Tax=Theileria equi strain WA TaxID=1537102 RepID=L0AXL9_THEEQ|nr:hypothetical protein BEWA_026150 [Theileria equi strain WA]AFZ79766.1 hypothetical protein BEWA_026150 [Theileria equi strain WA]|eukprot:XP_004829432.1 hypothetical protein BEWA_026150 [Theileria equi strain WA]